MRRLLVLAALVGLLAASAMAFSDPPPPTPAKALPAKVEARPALQVKVFRMANAELTNVAGALESLLGPPDELVPLPAAEGRPQSIPLGGCLGGCLGGGCSLPPFGYPLWRVTVSERAKAVVVRGTPKHLAIAADVVTVLDRAPNTPLPRTQNLMAFELKLATAEELRDVIEALAFEDVTMYAAGEKLLLVVAPEAERKTIAELVRNLDSDGKLDGE